MEKRKLLVSADELKKLYAVHQSMRKIAAMYNCDPDTVRERMIEYGIQRNTEKKFKFDPKVLETLYLEHKSSRKVAFILGCTGPTVLELLREHNIAMQKEGRARKYRMDDDFFSKDDEKSFYWAGFAAADFSINKKQPALQAKLSSKDRDHLEQFVSDIKSNVKITEISSTIHLRLTSNKIVDDLKRFNIVPNKTKTYYIPEWVLSHPFAHHFIRGYFDGAASFIIINENNRNRLDCVVVGTHATVASIQNIFVTNLGVTKNKQGNITRLAYSSKSDVQAIVDYLYKDATVYLKRKFKVALFGLYGPNRTTLNEKATLSSGNLIL